MSRSRGSTAVAAARSSSNSNSNSSSLKEAEAADAAPIAATAPAFTRALSLVPASAAHGRYFGPRGLLLAATEALLTVALLPHQRQGLGWLWHRERCCASAVTTAPATSTAAAAATAAGLLLRAAPAPPLSVRGGILADDCGLGKTLQVIALAVSDRIHLHGLSVPSDAESRSAAAEASASPEGDRSPNTSDADDDATRTVLSENVLLSALKGGARVSPAWFPPDNVSAAGASVSAPKAGTLIVVPPVLLAQWRAEIARFVRPTLPTVATESSSAPVSNSATKAEAMTNTQAKTKVGSKAKAKTPTSAKRNARVLVDSDSDNTSSSSSSSSSSGDSDSDETADSDSDSGSESSSGHSEGESGSDSRRRSKKTTTKKSSGNKLDSRKRSYSNDAGAAPPPQPLRRGPVVQSFLEAVRRDGSAVQCKLTVSTTLDLTDPDQAAATDKSNGDDEGSIVSTDSVSADEADVVAGGDWRPICVATTKVSATSKDAYPETVTKTETKTKTKVVRPKDGSIEQQHQWCMEAILAQSGLTPALDGITSAPVAAAAFFDLHPVSNNNSMNYSSIITDCELDSRKLATNLDCDKSKYPVTVTVPGQADASNTANADLTAKARSDIADFAARAAAVAAADAKAKRLNLPVPPIATATVRALFLRGSSANSSKSKNNKSVKSGNSRVNVKGKVSNKAKSRAIDDGEDNSCDIIGNSDDFDDNDDG